jgi:hypothetical protein
MGWDYRKKLMARWSIVTAGLTAIILIGWYLAKGTMPASNLIRMPDIWAFRLPLMISRWWDIIAIPIFVCLLILIFTSKVFQSEERYLKSHSFAIMVTNLALLLGLLLGIVIAVPFSLGKGVMIALINTFLFLLLAIPIAIGAIAIFALIFLVVLRIKKVGVNSKKIHRFSQFLDRIFSPIVQWLKVR